ncbi:MAG: hypothetical protein DCO96_03665 [Fluviicola sp. XM-24bin1]|nr:MAG: hypothetical protein DCO96_03665 [Fluviicola sp. XM-24bin1]
MLTAKTLNELVPHSDMCNELFDKTYPSGLHTAGFGNFFTVYQLIEEYPYSRLFAQKRPEPPKIKMIKEEFKKILKDAFERKRAEKNFVAYEKEEEYKRMRIFVEKEERRRARQNSK